MSKKRYRPEEIIVKLREADVLIGTVCKPRANNRLFRGEKGVAGGGKPLLQLERFQGARSAVTGTGGQEWHQNN